MVTVFDVYLKSEEVGSNICFMKYISSSLPTSFSENVKFTRLIDQNSSRFQKSILDCNKKTILKREPCTQHFYWKLYISENLSEIDKVHNVNQYTLTEQSIVNYENIH